MADQPIGKILARRKDGARWRIRVEDPSPPPRACPTCGSSVMHRHGRLTMTLADLPVDGCPVELTVVRQRWRCTECGRTVVADIPFKAKDFRMTERLRQYLIRQSAARTFSDVAREAGVDETTVRRAWDSAS